MNTKINLTYKGVAYTLEYNRMTVKLLEKSGFEIDDFLKKPLTNIDLAFAGAFIKNHPKISQETIDEIYNACPDKQGLIAALTQMISECYEVLLGEPDEKSGNAEWEIAK